MREIFTELRGEELRREIHVRPGDALRVRYVARDAGGSLEDTIFLGEGARLVYEGRFSARTRDFSNVVRVVHASPGSKSRVDVRGFVRAHARILTTGEISAPDCETSVNSTVFIFGSGRVEGHPDLLISDPSAKAYHSFRKLYLTPEQLFYLNSRGIEYRQIEGMYEQFILGD